MMKHEPRGTQNEHSSDISASNEATLDPHTHTHTHIHTWRRGSYYPKYSTIKWCPPPFFIIIIIIILYSLLPLIYLPMGYTTPTVYIQQHPTASGSIFFYFLCDFSVGVVYRGCYIISIFFINKYIYIYIGGCVNISGALSISLAFFLSFTKSLTISMPVGL